MSEYGEGVGGENCLEEQELDKYDYHAMMSAKPAEVETMTDPHINTIDGGEVRLFVSRTCYRDPTAPRWQIRIVAEDVEDPENPVDVAGHVCRCGDLHEHAGYGEDVEVITLSSDAWVRLAHEILRLAQPLSAEAPIADDHDGVGDGHH